MRTKLRGFAEEENRWSRHKRRYTIIIAHELIIIGCEIGLHKDQVIVFMIYIYIYYVYYVYYIIDRE